MDAASMRNPTPTCAASEREPLVSRAEENGVYEEKHGGFGICAVVGILRKRNHVSLSEGLMHHIRLLHQEVLRVGPDESGRNEPILLAINTDVAAAVQLDRRKHPLAFNHRLRL